MSIRSVVAALAFFIGSETVLSAVYTIPAVDLAGLPRVSHGAVDIGCYQRQLLPWGPSLTIR